MGVNRDIPGNPSDIQPDIRPDIRPGHSGPISPIFGNRVDPE